MRVFLSSMLAVGLCATAAGQAQQTEEIKYLKDTKSGCKLAVDPQYPDASLSWSGTCGADGVAAGEGVLTYRRGGIFFMERTIKGNGLQMDHGRALPDFRTIKAMSDVAQKDCGVVMVGVKPELDVADDTVAHWAIKFANNVPAEKCPGDSGGVLMCIYQGARPDFQNGTVFTQCPIWFQRQRNNYEWDFHGYRNRLREAREDQFKQRRFAEEAEEKRRLQAIQQANAQAASRTAAKNVADHRAAFMRQYSVISFPNVGEVSANPFRFSGQVVGLVQTFSKMIASDKALMSDIVLEGVPSTLFKGDETVLLAVKITGTTAVKTPLGGEVTAPKGTFVGVSRCADRQCSGYGFR